MAGIIDMKIAEILLFRLVASAKRAKGMDNNTNIAVKKKIDTGSTTSFSISGDRLKNEGLVMINSHSSPSNAKTLKNMFMIFSRHKLAMLV